MSKKWGRNQGQSDRRETKPSKKGWEGGELLIPLRNNCTFTEGGGKSSAQQKQKPNGETGRGKFGIPKGNQKKENEACGCRKVSKKERGK